MSIQSTTSDSSGPAGGTRGKTVADSRLRVVLLGAILLLALALRWTAAHAGLPYLHHWDEPTVAFASLEILKTGDFSPERFHYGSLPTYFHAGVDIVHFLRLAGKPPTEPEALWKLEDLEMSGLEQVRAQISHPSFILRNRQATAVLGTLCVLLAYLFARALGGEPAGFLAAGMLAVNEFHVRQSALVTVDVPASTAALAALWFSWTAWRRGDARDLLVSAGLVGLAIACKYNAAIYLAVPLTLAILGVVRRRTDFSAWLPVLVPGVMVAAFLVAMPFAVIDLPRFLDHAAYEVHHYLVLGQGEMSVEPGWPHLAVDLGFLVRYLGALPAFLAALGVVLACRHPAGRIVCLLPLVQLLLTARTLPAFHRNVVILYPVAAIGFGVACAAGWRWASRRWGARSRPALGIVILLVLVFVFWSVQRWRAALWYTRPETRSVAVDWIRDNRSTEKESGDENDSGSGSGAEGLLGVAEELVVHPLDLERLPRPHVVRPTRELLCEPDGETLVLVAGHHASVTDRAGELDRLVEGLVPLRKIGAPDRALWLERYSIHPQVVIAEGPATAGRPLACADGEVRHDELRLDGAVQRNARSLGLAPGAVTTTPSYRFPGGVARYALRLVAPPGVESTSYEVEALGTTKGGEPIVRRRWKLRAGPEDAARELQVELDRPEALRFRIEIPASSETGALLYGQWVATSESPSPASTG